MKKLFLLLPVLIIFSCNQDKKKAENVAIEEPIKRQDPHSFSNPEQCIVTHLDLKLKVNFTAKELNGEAVWTINNTQKVDEVIFDTKGLNIEKVTLDNQTDSAFFALGDEEEFTGKPLSIQITPQTKKIHIFYSTGENAAALQWLTAQQTAGKKQPYLFTQSEAILARTWIPTQDSPAIRFTYTADITVPKELLALMSAQNPTVKNETGQYHFEQKQAIPSYLMALAVGDITFKAIDNRTGVYAEPSMLEKVGYEFADMGKMVNTAEKLYGDYRWGRYDILVLPPSFPFGGMENPMLTFATPTVIAGDRSLVSLVAHELAHSWSGNLVTNATWNDFWLNEGFTVYFERRILEELYGPEEAKMQEVLGYNSLMETIQDLGEKSPDTRLNVDFTNRDPDGGVSDIAYEKGYFFLKNIEKAIGKTQFDSFLKSYFNEYAFKSMTNDRFLEEINTKLIKGNEEIKNKINSYAWVYQPGLPKEFKAPVSTKFKQIEILQKALNTSKNPVGLSNKISSTNEKLYFINTLPQNIGLNEIQAIDKEFGFSNSGNAEIQCAWYTLAAKTKYAVAYPPMKNFLINVGRRKFLMPIYKELIKTPEGKKLAKEIYLSARPNYHSVAYNSIDNLLK
ncbi:M1 family metallopeptidase [Pedobacter cryophilus]|uniref:Aminopeptidase N n=1 Tax=Pedobacter cryophilus TaxID=2571271 RepID=A0A4U1C4K8_9SPHI|nr:M1 family metallopeptidase [Pedobacter cryophilus]TKC00790.1 M1 family metallopeptidase [Pedobacter cryophilus]